MKILLFIFIFFFISCNADNTSLKPNDKVIYKNELITISKLEKALPDNINSIFINDFYDNANISFYFPSILFNFNSFIKQNFIKENKIISDKIFDAQTILIGYFNEFFILPTFNLTNLEHSILYKINLVYSLLDTNSNFIQKDISLKKEILCYDTNKYSKDFIENIIVSEFSKDIVNSVLYGWTFNEASNKIIIGDKNETNNPFAW